MCAFDRCVAGPTSNFAHDICIVWCVYIWAFLHASLREIHSKHGKHVCLCAGILGNMMYILISTHIARSLFYCRRAMHYNAMFNALVVSMLNRDANISCIVFEL